MDEDARRLAREIAYTLAELMPTADFSTELAGEVARVLGHDRAEEVQAITGLLAEAKTEMEQTAPGQRKTVKNAIYKRWTGQINDLIAVGLVSHDQAEELASALRRAVAGVGGRLYSDAPRRGSDQSARRNRPPGPPVGGSDDDDDE